MVSRRPRTDPGCSRQAAGQTDWSPLHLITLRECRDKHMSTYGPPFGFDPTIRCVAVCAALRQPEHVQPLKTAASRSHGFLRRSASVMRGELQWLCAGFALC